MNQINFDIQGLGQTLSEASSEQLNALAFGVIGFDNEGLVKVYNSCEPHRCPMSRFKTPNLHFPQGYPGVCPLAFSVPENPVPFVGINGMVTNSSRVANRIGSRALIDGS